jgi:hypothetical protein
MLRTLTIHPDSRCDAVTSIAVEALRPAPGSLLLHYAVTGRIGDLILPAPTAPGRADGLWRHTCFEVFLRAPPEEAYCELNFAPSFAWAAYTFARYRSGMAQADRIGDVRIDIDSNAERFQLEATVQLDGLPMLPWDQPWRLALSAVIEEQGGRLSYWALAHPPGKPDFHHADCFQLELPAASRR